jgi:hypothetical protein
MNLCIRFSVLFALSIANANGAIVLARSCRADISDTKEKLGGKVGAGVSKLQAVFDEKASRTPAQKKIDSQLLYALKQKRGDTRGVPTERIIIEVDQKGRALVDITAKVSPQITSQIRKLGGTVISEEPRYHTIRARLALEKLEALAALKDISFIAPAAQAMNNRINNRIRPN